MRRQTVFRLLLSTAVVLAFLLAGAVGFVLLRGSTLPPKDEMAVAVADIDSAAREPAPAAQPAAPPAAKIDYPADKELYKQGRALLRGDGIEADSIRAVAYLERAVSRGPDRGKAAFELGEAYLRGRFGVEADPVKARLYLDQAIELKHGGAPLTLGRALLFGEGLEAEPDAGAAML